MNRATRRMMVATIKMHALVHNASSMHNTADSRIVVRFWLVSTSNGTVTATLNLNRQKWNV